MAAETKPRFKRRATGSSKPLQVGDRVIVTNTDHPHYEEVGTVTTAPRSVSIMGMPPSVWLEVEGDWATFGAKPQDVRRIRDLT